MVRDVGFNMVVAGGAFAALTWCLQVGLDTVFRSRDYRRWWAPWSEMTEERTGFLVRFAVFIAFAATGVLLLALAGAQDTIG